jgi:hypothetical protein
MGFAVLPHLLRFIGVVFPSRRFLCIMTGYRGNPVIQAWGPIMRKGALLLTVLLAAAFSTTANAQGRKAAAPKPDPAIAAQKNTDNLYRAMFTAGMPQAAAAPAPAKKAKRTAKKGKKMSKKKG